MKPTEERAVLERAAKAMDEWDKQEVCAIRPSEAIRALPLTSKESAAAPTPRTDEEAAGWGHREPGFMSANPGTHYVRESFARQLEHELSAEREAHKQTSRQANEAIETANASCAADQGYKEKYLLLSAQHKRLCDEVYEEDGETLKIVAEHKAREEETAPNMSTNSRPTSYWPRSNGS